MGSDIADQVVGPNRQELVPSLGAGSAAPPYSHPPPNSFNAPQDHTYI